MKTEVRAQTMKRGRKTSLGKDVATETQGGKQVDSITPKKAVAKALGGSGRAPPKKRGTDKEEVTSPRGPGPMQPTVEERKAMQKQVRKAPWEKEMESIQEELEKVPTVYSERLKQYEMNFQSREYTILETTGKTKRFQKLQQQKKKRMKKKAYRSPHGPRLEEGRRKVATI